MGSYRGKAAKAEKKAMNKRVSLRMEMWMLEWRIERERPERVAELQPKLEKLKEEYVRLGGRL